MKMVPVPLPSIHRTGTCWHYTNAAGLLGIVQSGTFWASSAVTALNDSSELEYGRTIFAGAAEILAEETVGSDLSDYRAVFTPAAMAHLLGSVFVLSASKDGDSINQWMHYGRAGGFAIELDMSVPLNTRNGHMLLSGLTPDATTNAANLIPRPGWSDVTYDAANQKSEALDLLRSELQFEDHQQTALIALDAIARMKHPAFKAEDEVRSLFRNAVHTAKFREVNGRPVMYIEAVQPAGTSTGLPIKSVRLGPGSDQRTVTTVRALLDSKGYEHVGVSVSEMPLV
jgi:hypothetical protein